MEAKHGKSARLCLLLMSLVLGQHCSAVTKQWRPDTNWGNLANWNKGRVPCEKDDVQLNRGVSLSVSLRSSRSIKSLSLPMNGELIFYEDSELSFAGEEGETNLCDDSGDIQFVASAHDWYNPYNWQEIEDNNQPTSFSSSFSSSIVLHMDNVPCVHDNVVFPQLSSFQVKSDKPITVASVELFGQVQSSNSFKEYYSSSSGSLQFNFTDSTGLTAEQCSDQTGCPCGYLKFSKTICSHVNCSEPSCVEAVRPEGSCCDVCGVVLGLDLDVQAFKFNVFKGLLLNVSQKEYSGVDVAISKTEEGAVQVVFTDQGNGKEAHIAAGYLKEKIVAEERFNVVGAKVVQQSSFHATTVTQKGKSKGTIIPLAVGITLLVVFLITVVFLIFRRTQRIRSHSFPDVFDDGFEVELDDMQDTVDTAKDNQPEHDSTEPNYENTGWNNLEETEEGQENPLYEPYTG